MSDIYELRRGNSPLLVSMPHSGESLGPYMPRMTEAALRIADTDWHLPKLYDFLPELDATVLAASHSRYVVDLNRDPSGKSLYPGQNVTELCPTTTFDEAPIYNEGEMPHVDEIAERVETYWQPYHTAIVTELARIKSIHGYALLWDAHSIASEVPRFFAGRLPDLNFGTDGGKSCGSGLGKTLKHTSQNFSDYPAVLNGRFKGGFITRKYGAPDDNIHAVQLELSQITYMNEAYPFEYCSSKASQIAQPIRTVMEAMLDWSAAQYA